MTRLQREINQQPEVIQRLLEENRAETNLVAEAIRAHEPAFVCIAARGTSHHAALYAQYLFGQRLALPVMQAAPSLQTVYQSGPELSRALVIGISQSGQAEDVRAVLGDARGQGALTLAITNFADSTLAVAAAHHLPLRAEREFSVAATKTYTAQLTVIAMLASALVEDEAMWAGLGSLPGLARETLERSEGITAWAERYRYSDRLVTLGRGFNLATAREISLKVKELTYIASEGYSEADFRHGPIAGVERGHPVMLVAPSGRTLPGMQAMARDLAERGAERLIISDEAGLLESATKALPIPIAPEWLSPVIAVMPGQVYALRQAQIRGYAVDTPRGLSKVTVTA